VKLGIFSTDFRKIHIKFDGNPSCGRPNVPCGRIETDMTKLVVALEILRTPLVMFPSNLANFNMLRMSVTYKFFTQYAHFEGKGKEKFNLNLNYKS